jgi:hypothetical protein
MMTFMMNFKDNEENKNIRNKTKEELLQGMITEDTLIRILKWVSFHSFSKVSPRLRLYGYGKYEAGIKKALDSPKDQKLSILVNDPNLFGIGVVQPQQFYISFILLSFL